MSSFFFAFLYLSLTDFSMSASIPETEVLSEDNDGFEIAESYIIRDVLTIEDDLGRAICRALTFFKATLIYIKGVYSGEKENQGENNLTEIKEDKDFEKQCLETVSFIEKASSSTQTNLEKLTMILTMKKMLDDFRYQLVDSA